MILTTEPISKESIIHQLYPNFPIFIAHIIATIILLLVARKWLYRPFCDLLHKRHLAIKAKLDNATIHEALANKDRGLAMKMLNEAKIKSQTIINEAQTKAFEVHREIIEKTQNEVRMINSEAKLAVIREKKIMEQKIKNEIQTVAFEVVKKILATEIDNKKHQKLIDDFINQIDNRK